MHCCTSACSQVVLIASDSPLEPVADSHEHALDAAVLQLGEPSKPEPRALCAITSPDAQDVASLIRRDAHDDIEPGCCGPARSGPTPTITSTKTTGQATSNGRKNHFASSPVTFSMTRLMVFLETLGP